MPELISSQLGYWRLSSSTLGKSPVILFRLAMVHRSRIATVDPAAYLQQHLRSQATQ